jgi:hypothetical protein
MAFFMALAGNGISPFSLSKKEEYQHLTDDEKRDLEERVMEKYKKVMIKKGLSEFTIDGITVLALNRKNAQRKIDKLKLRL